jgi:GH24 family phage-related lysozyme (muramidase)
MKQHYEDAHYEEIGGQVQKSEPPPFLTKRFVIVGAITALAYNYATKERESRDVLAFTDQPEEDTQFGLMATAPEAKAAAKVPEHTQGHDLFKYVMLETKRREALGRRGKELESYMDGDSPAIGYGNRIKYLPAKWKQVVDEQGYKVTEAQARAMMYDTFDSLKETISADLPHLDRHELWAVQSLAFNWGYGNIKKSALYQHLKAGNKTGEARRAWMKCHAATDNHRTSRRFEWALYTGDFKEAKKYADKAYNSIAGRGDLKHY